MDFSSSCILLEGGLVYVQGVKGTMEKNKDRQEVKGEIKNVKKFTQGLKYIEILNEI